MIGRQAAGAMIMAAVYLCVMLFAELWSRLAPPGRDWPRHLLHVAAGLQMLILPRFIDSPAFVLGLATLFTALGFFGRRGGLLRSLRVGRPSCGSELYPLALFLVFVVARDRSWLYVGSILTVALADAAAAIVGAAYGRNRYRIGDESRSLEGSLAFLATAFICLFLSMLWLGPFDGRRCAPAAALAALLATALEAVSLRGTDNLVVPLSLCWLLPRLVG